MAPGDCRSLPQHRSSVDQLPHPSWRRAAERGLPLVSSARALRQDWRADDGYRDRSLRQFLVAGSEYASARDWVRLGNLYLQDGVWNGERILPEGYSEFVRTVAPAWAADNNPVYGAFFWLNNLGSFPVPKSAYYMSGAGGQTTLIVPSHDLVVVRLGHFKGAQAGTRAFRAHWSCSWTPYPPCIDRELEITTLSCFGDLTLLSVDLVPVCNAFANSRLPATRLRSSPSRRNWSR